MNEPKNQMSATTVRTGVTQPDRAPMPARLAVGLVAGLTGAITWVVAGLFWDLLRDTDVLRHLAPRGFAGFNNLAVTGGPWQWIGVVALAVVIILVVLVSVARAGGRGNRATYFFAGWFAAVLAASTAAAVATTGVLTSVTASSDQGAQLLTQAVAGATYWGLMAGWLVGFATVVGAGLISTPEEAGDVIRVDAGGNGRRAPQAPVGRRSTIAPNGWSPEQHRGN